MKRRVVADAPNHLWLTDIAEHRTGEGKLYFCVVDVYSNRIFGYSIGSWMKETRLAVAAIISDPDLATSHGS